MAYQSFLESFPKLYKSYFGELFAVSPKAQLCKDEGWDRKWYSLPGQQEK